MTTGTVKTQGTELFFINPSGGALVKMLCPTGITGLGGAASQIPSTCLDTVGDETFEGGLGSPGQVTVPFNLIPRDVSHQQLFALKEARTVLSWIACLSESTTDPTVASGAIVPPIDRTSLEFSGYIADLTLDIETNNLVKGTMQIQRSGSITPTWYEP